MVMEETVQKRNGYHAVFTLAVLLALLLIMPEKVKAAETTSHAELLADAAQTVFARAIKNGADAETALALARQAVHANEAKASQEEVQEVPAPSENAQEQEEILPAADSPENVEGALAADATVGESGAAGAVTDDEAATAADPATVQDAVSAPEIPEEDGAAEADGTAETAASEESLPAETSDPADDIPQQDEPQAGETDTAEAGSEEDAAEQETDAADAEEVVDTFEKAAINVQEVYQQAIESGFDKETAMKLASDTAYAHGKALYQLHQAREALERSRNKNNDYHEGYEPTEEEIRLVAALVFCEAGNQCYRGKVAISNVVLNRMKSDEFPNNVRAVIYQPGQFEPVTLGWYARVLRTNEIPEECYRAARDGLGGETPVGDALYFSRSYLHRGGLIIQDHAFW